MTFEDGLRRIGWAIAFFVGGFIFPLLWFVSAFILIAWWSDFFGQGSTPPKASTPPKKPQLPPTPPRSGSANPGSPAPAQSTSKSVARADNKNISLDALIAPLESPQLNSANNSTPRKRTKEIPPKTIKAEPLPSPTGSATSESIGYEDISQALRELENREPRTTRLIKQPRPRRINPRQISYNNFVAKFQPKCFYHFTDTRNVDSIIEVGALLSAREMEQTKVSAIAPGGSKGSRISDKNNGMDAYVHLCFSDENPMEWTAKQDGRIAESIFLEIDPNVLLTEGVLLTPGFSNTRGIVPVTLEQALEQFDFEILYQRIDWRDESQRIRIGTARKYEILVPGSIPVDSIMNLERLRTVAASNKKSSTQSWNDDIPF